MRAYRCYLFENRIDAVETFECTDDDEASNTKPH
jgi:hypothetical protein